MTVHVLGNLCIDTTLSVPRFPVPGETMVALGVSTGLGGKGVNQAVAAARAGAAVVLHAAIGHAEVLGVTERLAAETRLDLRLARLQGPSDTSTILVRPDGENMIISTTGCARAFMPESAGWADLLKAGDVLLMQGNLSAGATADSVAEGRRRAAVTVLNPSPLWHGQVPIWPDIDWLVVNAIELATLSGDPDPGRGAAIMRDKGVGALAVTLGARGAFVLDADGRADATAPAITVHDTSGAGDVFCGVFVAHLSRGSDVDQALARAVSAASLSATRPGALAACPTAAEMAALHASQTRRRSR